MLETNNENSVEVMTAGNEGCVWDVDLSPLSKVIKNLCSSGVLRGISLVKLIR